jgi:hypothetical protein
VVVLVMAHHVNGGVVPAKSAELIINRLTEDTTLMMTSLKKTRAHLTAVNGILPDLRWE